MNEHRAEATGFLYPFLEQEEDDAPGLLADLAESARAKMAESAALRVAMLEHAGGTLVRAAAETSARLAAGGRLLAFGNGGSATDAQAAVDLFTRPPDGRPLPALSLVDDQGVLTALANDVGVEVVFARQLIAHARPDDVVMGFSTSGNSKNVLAAFEEAARRELCTVGFSGYEGGAMAASSCVRHCFVVASESVHRIQEAQNALLLALWLAIRHELDSATAGRTVR